jgi:N-methylhydantoinase B
MTEYLYPLVALWRREQTDSGGPGRQRGGMSGSVCYVQHPDQSGPMSLVVSGTGKVVNQNVGLAGGYPGNSQVDLVIRNIDEPQLAGAHGIPSGLDELGGDLEVLPCEGESTLGPADALYLHWQAGGGYGDPLLRPAEKVRDDVAQLRVSPGAARDVYGVALGADLEVDIAATVLSRQHLRRERAAGAGLPAEPGRPVSGQPQLEHARRLDDNFAVVDSPDGASVACVHCGEVAGPIADGRFLTSLVRWDAPVTGAGPQIWADPAAYTDAEIVFRRLLCPACLTAVYSRVVPVDHPLPADVFRSFT